MADLPAHGSCWAVLTSPDERIVRGLYHLNDDFFGRVAGYFVLLPLTGSAARFTRDGNSTPNISRPDERTPKRCTSASSAGSVRSVSQAFIRAGTIAGLRALERYAKRKCAIDSLIERFLLEDALPRALRR